MRLEDCRNANMIKKSLNRRGTRDNDREAQGTSISKLVGELVKCKSNRKLMVA